MEVLNTIASEPIMAMSGLGILYAVLIFLGIAIATAACNANSGGGMLFGLILAVVSVVLFINSPEKPTGEVTPTKLEVKINDPNYVIDATKYKIIEKRGEIYTLEVLQ